MLLGSRYKPVNSFLVALDFFVKDSGDQTEDIRQISIRNSFISSTNGEICDL